MGLGIGAVGSEAGSIRAGDTDIERIARLEANPNPLAARFGIDNLNLDIETVRFLHIRQGYRIITVPALRVKFPGMTVAGLRGSSNATPTWMTPSFRLMVPAPVTTGALVSGSTCNVAIALLVKPTRVMP